MAIKLLRESSETPNISNKDDVRMVRYAYGGYDGVIQKYGEEYAATVTGSSLRIGSGRAVVNGWEVDIDGAGIVIDLSHMSYGSYYYTVYLEVNAELETVAVKTLYDTAEYPRVNTGDDLTEAQSGTATLELYHFTISSGTISNVARVCVLIPYGKKNYENLDNALKSFKSTTEYNFSQVNNKLNTHTSQISSIESRLSNLGFRQGSCSGSYISSTQINSLKKQGKYVIFNFAAYAANGAPSMTLYIPSEFRPKSSINFVALVNGNAVTATLYTSGSVGFGFTVISNFVSIQNIGWETD